MATDNEQDDVRPYFTEDEWTKMPDFMKQRYVNIKRNYDMMVALGTPSRSSTLRRYPKRNRKEVICTQTYETSDDENSDSESSSSSDGSKPTKRKRKTIGSNQVSGMRRAVRAWCQRDQTGKCPAHGPSGYDKDAALSVESLERAKESLPDGLRILRSRLRGAQLGVFTLASLKEGVCFGPYKPSNVEEQRSREELPAADSGLQRAIWMRFVNCAPTEDRANLVPLSKDGAVYYSMCKTVGTVEELLVWCNGSSTVTHPLKAKAAEQKPSFACPVCAREFPKSSSVKKHMLSHTREKSHQCPECGERFGAANTLRHHRRMHSSDVSYKCATCGEGFGNWSNLKNHLWVHRDTKPFACAVCGREFSTLLYAKRHEFREHGKF
ncbi:histone-lysine N-methyltransferase PRDM9-like isoform X3 [Amblyomma americanum]